MDDVALTSNAGDGGSNIFFRFYDKDKEQAEKKISPLRTLEARNARKFICVKIAQMRFRGAVKPLKMTIDKPDSTLIDTINWLKTGGALSAVRAFQCLEKNDALSGLSTIDELMQDVKFSNSLVNKLTASLMGTGKYALIQQVAKLNKA